MNAMKKKRRGMIIEVSNIKAAVNYKYIVRKGNSY
jgi:hypothetical protein